MDAYLISNDEIYSLWFCSLDIEKNKFNLVKDKRLYV